MDLGIKGKKAIINGGSAGMGKGSALALAKEGVDLFISARREKRLLETCEEIEQNTDATRNRFLNIVNPYLDSVRSQQGLSAFRVVMDDTNNTPDLIDQNILYGQIFLQPTRTAEFIVLDFNIQPTGASFPE